MNRRGGAARQRRGLFGLLGLLGLLVVTASVGGCGSSGTTPSASPGRLPAGLCAGLAHSLGPAWGVRSTTSSATTQSCSGTRAGVELGLTVTRFPDHAVAVQSTASLRHDDFAFFRTSYPPTRVVEHPVPAGWSGRLASVVYPPDPSAPTTRLVSTVSDLARGDDAVHLTLTGPRTARAAAAVRASRDGVTVGAVARALADALAS